MEENNLNEDIISKIMARVTNALFLAVPVQFIVLLLGGLIAYIPYGLLRGFLGVHTTNSIEAEAIWNRSWGLGMYVVYVLIHSLLRHRFKYGIKYDLIGIQITSFILLRISSHISRGGFFSLDFASDIAYILFDTIIMFSVFIVLTILFDKYTKLKEWLKALLSFVLSVLVGGAFTLLLGA